MSEAAAPRSVDGEKLGKVRAQLGWTQARAAQELEISRTHYIRLENGQAKAGLDITRRAVSVMGAGVLEDAATD